MVKLIFLEFEMIKLLKTINIVSDVKIKIFQKKESEKVNLLPIFVNDRCIKFKVLLSLFKDSAI